MTDLFEIEAPTTTTSLELRRLQRDMRRRQRRIRTLVASAIGLVVLALGASIAWNFILAFRPAADEVKDYEGLGQGQVPITINQGDDGATIAKTLFDKGVIASEQAFLLETYANPTGALKIQPGYYILAKEMKAEYALAMLIDPGDRKITKSFQVIPGDRLTKILEKIAAQGGFSLEEVQLAAEDTVALGLPPEAEGNLEGWLAADKFFFNPDVHPADVLAAMIRQTVTVLEDLGVPREEWEDTLKIASMIEKEAGSDDDRYNISSVIQNRLHADPAWQLKFCSTVLYDHPEFMDDGRLLDSEIQVASPNNTYIIQGLPISPIASPGEESIKAAFSPPDTPYFYFNLGYGGVTTFSVTGAEALANKHQYDEWCSEQPAGVCINQKPIQTS
jgi:UPF0755 protein